jgi:hypothetical protein
MKRYLVKKGPADPFRGDWYIHESDFQEQSEAIETAATLTLENFHQLKSSWAEFGYEWSVFERREESEKKIWEGYKYIQAVKNRETTGGFELGLLY